MIGTAGHVDHGKSTLILALTGRDPDRFAEEKLRGLTIDLGFAWMTLPDGTEVSFVDVPGHSDFMKNMLAGATGIDAALLVVAADEGWMAQTEEHLAALDLLGIQHGLVAVTKADKVADFHLTSTIAEVTTKLEGTNLERCAVVPVAATRGDGMEELVEAISRVVGKLEPQSNGRPRLWIDRSFTLRGVGTVVTGTLQGGELTIGNQVEIWPSRSRPRIRTLQAHERPVNTAKSGQRTAVGLVGVRRSDISRGHMLGLIDQWLPTDRALIRYRLARNADRLSEKGAYHCHIGTGVVLLRLRVVDRDLALATFEANICLQVGDKIIIRDVGRNKILAGGTVIDPDPPQGRRLAQAAHQLHEIENLSPNSQADKLLAVRGQETLNRLSAQTGGGTPTTDLAADGVTLSPEEAALKLTQARGLVKEHQDRNPLDQGIRKATLAHQLQLSAALLNRILEVAPDLTDLGALVASQGRYPFLSSDDVIAWTTAKTRLRQEWPQVPTLSQLGLPTPVVHHLIRASELVKISEDLLLLPEQVRQLLTTLEQVPQEFTVSDFRQRAQVSRKCAIPFLEWSDHQGITQRHGDLHRRNSGGERESNPPGTETTPHRF